MSLKECRSEMEEIDDEIIRLIDKRTSISKRIFEAKRVEGMPIRDPLRESLVLSKAMDLATELNLDTGAIKTIFEILITMSLQKQQELQGRNQS